MCVRVGGAWEGGRGWRGVQGGRAVEWWRGRGADGSWNRKQGGAACYQCLAPFLLLPHIHASFPSLPMPSHLLCHPGHPSSSSSSPPRFDLAIQLGDLSTAQEIAGSLDTPAKWRQLGELALGQGQLPMAAACLSKADDLSGLLLLAATQVRRGVWWVCCVCVGGGEGAGCSM